MKKVLPLGDRVTLKVELITKKNEEGQEFTDISKEAKVLDSNNPDIPKGATVYYNPRGCINVEVLSTKKYITLIVEAIDVYGICK